MTFEKSEFVVFNKHLIFQSNLHHPKTGELLFDQLSPMLGQFFEDFSKAIEFYMPEIDMIAFESLDPKSWNIDVPGMFNLPDIKKVAEMFGMNEHLAQEQFVDLVTKIVGGNWQFWCEFKLSDPAFFWSHVLMRFKPPQEISDIIKMTLAIPLSSADSERSFSILNHIKGNLFH